MAYCVNCGSELPKNAKFCFECGAKLSPPSQVQKEQNKEKTPISFDEIDDSFDYVEESVVTIPASAKADKSDEVKEASKESVSDNSSTLDEQIIPDESSEPVDTDEPKAYDEPAIPVSQEEQEVSVEPDATDETNETEVLGESEGLDEADEMDELEETEEVDEKTDTGAEKLSFSDLSTYESTSHSDFRENRNMKTTQEQPVYVTSPDADPYWDDVLPEIDNEIYQIPKDIFLKAIGIIVGLIAIMAWLIYWIPQF